MKDIEELCKKIVKFSKDKESVYFYGVEYHSDHEPTYKAYVGFTKKGVNPVIASATSKRALKKILQNYLDNEGQVDHICQFYKAEIETTQRLIRTYEDMIKDHESTHSELSA